MSEPFLGQITLFPYTFPPINWADCQGQLLPISQNTALFSLLGVNFGGNGTSNFALPDLQGRVAVGQGTLAGGGDYIVGEAAGVETVTLLTSTMPLHNHSLDATTALGSTNAPAGTVLATVAKGPLQSRDKGNIYDPAAPNTTLVAQSLQPAGSGTPHNNVQPSLVLRYCIALNGIFPARS
jgi:microcystin-dependent protein